MAENLCFPGPPIHRPDLFVSPSPLPKYSLFWKPSLKNGKRSGRHFHGLPQNGSEKSASKSVSANGVHNRVKDNRRPRHEKPSGKPIPDLIPENGMTAATGAFKRKRRPDPSERQHKVVIPQCETDENGFTVNLQGTGRADRGIRNTRVPSRSWRERSEPASFPVPSGDIPSGAARPDRASDG